MNFKPLCSKAPVTSILNSAFKYTPAARTNVADTWARYLKKPQIKIVAVDQVTPRLKEAA